MILISNSFVILARTTKFLYFFSGTVTNHFSRIQRESTIDNRFGRSRATLRTIVPLFLPYFSIQSRGIAFSWGKIVLVGKIFIERIYFNLFCLFHSFISCLLVFTREILDRRNAVSLKQFGKVSKARLRVDCWLIERFDIWGCSYW